MKALVSFLALVIVAAPVAAAAEDVTIRSKDGFALRASYHAAENPGPCVLLLHQCNRDRTAYDDLAPALAEAGLHVLAIDFRGFGESKSEEAADFHAQSEELWPRFAEDVEAAIEYLASRPGADALRIGILGASCGGAQALLAANRRPEVRTLALLSSSLPWIDEKDIKEFESERAIPLLCIAGEEDRGTYERTRRIFQSSKSPDTRLILYKGNAHGAPLFDHDPILIQVITDWFVRRLR
ncbi:MAG: alpha/beta fold hydrolase [Candidatus Eisenbacteria bacterium]